MSNVNDHHAAVILSGNDVTLQDPNSVSMVLDQVLNELDQARTGHYPEGVEERLARLELAVLTLATSILNGRIG